MFTIISAVILIAILILKVIFKNKFTLTYLFQRYLIWKSLKKAKDNQEKKYKQQKEVEDNIKKLNEFVKFLENKVCKNRKERRDFYQKVINGEPIIGEYLQRIVDSYKKENNNER